MFRFWTMDGMALWPGEKRNEQGELHILSGFFLRIASKMQHKLWKSNRWHQSHRVKGGKKSLKIRHRRQWTFENIREEVADRVAAGLQKSVLESSWLFSWVLSCVTTGWDCEARQRTALGRYELNGGSRSCRLLRDMRVPTNKYRNCGEHSEHSAKTSQRLLFRKRVAGDPVKRII